MLKYDPLACLPSSEELPDSDDTPGILPREWLYWYDRQEQRLLTPQEQAQQAEIRAQLLAERSRSLGIDPDSLS